MLRTIFCFTFIGISMPLLVPIGVIVLFVRLLGFRKLTSFIMTHICHAWGRIMIAFVGSKVTVSGIENVPLKGGVCFVSNHGSFFDIALLLAYCPRHIGFAAKKELLLIPFLNIWIAMLGGLFIDRKNPRKALKSFNAGIKRIRAGGTIIIFPEGHRSRGQGLLPFHPGSLKLATQSGAVIVPVAIAGTYDVYEKTYRVNPLPVKIAFCAPINTASLPAADRKQALSNHVYAVIQDALNRGAV